MGSCCIVILRTNSIRLYPTEITLHHFDSEGEHMKLFDKLLFAENKDAFIARLE